MSFKSLNEIPDAVSGLSRELLPGLDRILGDQLVGLYVYGAAAFPDDGGVLGDIDFHVILKDPLDELSKTALLELHETLAREHPLLGAALDGYYILLRDAQKAGIPQHQLLPDVYDQSWALHRAHMWAGRAIVLKGPDPKDLFPAASWPELDAALQGELEYVKAHLDQYPPYCVLNLCRLIYSYSTRDVVISKRASALWAIEALPAWRPLIEAASRSYEHQATDADQHILESQVHDFFAYSCKRIQESKEYDQPYDPI